MELTKDDLYEIEKVLDIYAGWINDKLNQYCQTSIHYEAMKLDVKKGKVQGISPLAETIGHLKKAYDRTKVIRDKLSNSRKDK